ncbi:hypothetical protein chiPu_0013047 [Chiloscyllium punctatum]|uniref:Uncharacterized protein n=1 Tax=Chiloscyllium punctatum TaxID=137246 RepID=A0A401SVZ5_CHIPU|nr:hypothetical protein [Chiloscyllium punctatum]
MQDMTWGKGSFRPVDGGCLEFVVANLSLPRKGNWICTAAEEGLEASEGPGSRGLRDRTPHQDLTDWLDPPGPECHPPLNGEGKVLCRSRQCGQIPDEGLLPEPEGRQPQKSGSVRGGFVSVGCTVSDPNEETPPSCGLPATGRTDVGLAAIFVGGTAEPLRGSRALQRRGVEVLVLG